MAYQYSVSVGASATGPWTLFNQVAVTTDTVTGLASGTTYFFQIIVTDLVTGIVSAPIVAGPFTTTAVSTESAAGSTVTASSQTIMSSQTPGQAAPLNGPFDTWSITGANGQVVHNTATDSHTGNIIELYYVNHFVYQEANAANGLGLNPGWWQWTGGTTGNGFGWTDSQDPRPTGPTITMNAITGQATNTPFGVSGLLQNYTTAPTLQYEDNTSAFTQIGAANSGSVTNTLFSFTHPAVTTSTAAMTVTVRDSANTAVSVTSNSFAVVAPGQITLQGISLSSLTVPANAAVGTVVGAITVQTTGGAFSGNLSLSAGTTNFSLNGSNLVTAVGLQPGGPYAVTIVATMNGAVGSPLSKSFNITATTGVVTGFSISSTSVSNPTGNLVNVNLTAPVSSSGKILTVPRELYGVAMSTSNGNWNSSLASSQWVADMRNFNFGYLRVQGETTLSAIFSGQQTSNPNWNGIAPVISNVNTAFPNATLHWTIGWLTSSWPNSGGNFNVSWSQTALNNLASQCSQLAQHFKSNGVNIAVWDLFNEPDIQGASDGPNGTTTSTSVVQQVCATVYPAIAAVDSNYKFSTCPTSFLRNHSYIQAGINAYSATSICGGHWYDGGSDLGTSSNIADGNNLANSINGDTTFSNLLFSLNEYALDYNHNSAGIQTIVEAVFAAMFTAQTVQQNQLWAGGVWDAAQSGFGFTIGSYAPIVYFLSKAGLTMPGNIVVNNTSGNGLLTLASTSGVMVINSNQSGSASGTVSIGGLLNTTLHRWQQTNSSGAGTVTSVTVGSGGVVANQSFPSLSVTIYYP